MEPGRITYVGHATALIEIGGRRFLTDPLLRPRVAHLRRRVRAPEAVELSNLDGILLSHGHHDHLDVPSLRALPGRPPLLAGPTAALTLRRLGLGRSQRLEVGESERVGDVLVTAVLASHDGRRWPWQRRSDSVGFLLEAPDAPAVYFAGDTDLFEGMSELAPRVDVALLPITGWGPKVGPGHLDPERAAEAAHRMRPEIVVPIHWGTYSRVGMESEAPALRRPLEEFAAQLAERAPSVAVAALAPGESLELSGPDFT